MAFEDFAEYGQYTVNSDWTSITLSKAYTRDIAIFAEVNSFNDGDPSSNRARNTLAPVEIRLQNISKGSGATPASFDIKIQRPYGYSTTHPNETVSYLAISSGTWDLVDGSRLEVGVFDRKHLKNNKFQSVVFNSSFSNKPGVISQVQTYIGDQWITLRQKNINENGFSIAHQEDEYYNKHGDKSHKIESLAYLAFDDGFSTTDGNSLLEGRILDSSSEKIDHTGETFSFLTTSYQQSPVLITQNSSRNGGDPSKTRLSSLSSDQFDVYIQEDRSRDNETWHKYEEFSYFAVGDGTKFQGEFVDPAAAPSIQGFSGNPGDASSSITINENTTEIGTLGANESVSWSISGGADSALFSINSTTGELSFNSAQDYESPGDADSNNDFIVQVTATDSDSNTSSQSITINVGDIDEVAPVANDNSETLSGSNIAGDMTILSNDSDNIDSPSSLKIYSVGGTLFEDLDDSEHTTYDSSNEYKQISGTSGTLYIKQNGTAYYIKTSGTSLRSSSPTNLRLGSSIKLFTTALIASGSSNSESINTSQSLSTSSIDSFDYVIKDSSGNTSNTAKILLSTTLNQPAEAPCFASNTNILLEDGTQKLVQNLIQGDRVMTHRGVREVLWIGKKYFSQNDLKSKKRDCPIAFLPGSLGENIPTKALYVSEGHYLYINGKLIAAGCLVNGINIVRVSANILINGVCYWHIDLGQEELVMSNACWTGSYYCFFNRRNFSNHSDFTGDPDRCTKKLDLPRHASVYEVKEDYKYLTRRAMSMVANETSELEKRRTSLSCK